MRLSIKVTSNKKIDYYRFNKYYIQSAIYSFLVGTNYENLHNNRSFKFFTFSDAFPSGCLNPGEEKTIIISSPDEEFINTLYEKMNLIGIIYFNDEPLQISSLKKFSINLKKVVFETGSPIVLYKDNKENKYLSFKKGDTLNFFLERLRDNSIKKIRAYYGEDYEWDQLIFDTLSFHKEVSIQFKKFNSSFIIIGTVWYKLEKSRYDRKLLNLYNFIMETGLGEKNSLGFGFVSPKREVSSIA